MLGCCWKQRKEAAGAAIQESSEDLMVFAQEELTGVLPELQAVH